MGRILGLLQRRERPSSGAVVGPDGWSARADSRLPVLDVLEKADRLTITKLAAQHGPVFDAVMHGEPCVCIVGIARGRRLLREHADSLRPYTIALEPLVPKGFLRQMNGEDHLGYRRALLRAARRLDDVVEVAVVESIAVDALRAMSERDDAQLAPALLDTAVDIATASLIALFFGGRPGEAPFDELVGGFRRLGPHGLVWNIGDAQHRAFEDLCSQLRARLADRERPVPQECVLGVLAEDHIDDTLLGNLIYMVEMGRFDLQVFVRWILRYSAANPEALDVIATGGTVGAAAAEAFVLEVLRNDQSERLMRRALTDIEFEGHRICAGSFVRICMWEVHHEEQVFPDPYRFDPTRFVGTAPGPDDFAPFGIDHHQCPFGGMSIRFGAAVVGALARGMRPRLIHDGPPVRGAYHWEPSRRLSIGLEPR